jgi:hypothetical protein
MIKTRRPKYTPFDMVSPFIPMVICFMLSYMASHPIREMLLFVGVILADVAMLCTDYKAFRRTELKSTFNVEKEKEHDSV